MLSFGAFGVIPLSRAPYKLKDEYICHTSEETPILNAAFGAALHRFKERQAIKRTHWVWWNYLSFSLASKVGKPNLKTIVRGFGQGKNIALLAEKPGTRRWSLRSYPLVVCIQHRNGSKRKLVVLWVKSEQENPRSQFAWQWRDVKLIYVCFRLWSLPSKTQHFARGAKCPHAHYLSGVSWEKRQHELQ